MLESAGYAHGHSGFLQEHGPHILSQGADRLAPSKNPFSWNNNAHMLFLESPPGVGFSLNKDAAYNYTDTRTAQDNLLAIT
jgi:carboxypeptidase C (cathepsin A)